MTAPDPAHRTALIVADDLTGAADAAVAFAAGGAPTWVVLSVDAPVPAAVRVVAMATRARRTGDPAEIAGAVRRLAPTAGEVFVKIDSLLRGEPGAVVAAVVDACPWVAEVLMAPALPAHGRVTRGGVQLAAGRPVGRVDTGAADLRIPLTVADAETDDDLRAIVAAVRGRRGVLWVGSAGLAAALAAVLVGGSTPRRLPALPRDARVVAVVGSRQPIAHRQAERLRAAVPPVAVHRPLAPPGPSLEDPSIVEDMVREALGGLRAAGALVLTGGDTARAVLDALGVAALEVIGQPERGVVASRAHGDWTGVVLTKAGSFGDEGTLVRAVALLAG